MVQTHTIRAFQALENDYPRAQRAGDHLVQGWPLPHTSLMLNLLGQFDAAETIAVEICERASKTHNWASYATALSALTYVAVARGNFDTAERYAHETLMLVSRCRDPWGGYRAILALACAHTLRGASAKAEEILAILMESGRFFVNMGAGMRTSVEVLRQVLRHRFTASSEVEKRVHANGWTARRGQSYALASLCALVEMAELTATPTIATLPYQRLSQALARGVLFSPGWVMLIPRVLGVAATLNRWWDKAEAHFHMAMDIASRVGALPALGRTYLDYARMLAARGRMRDYHRVIVLARQASTQLQALGMAALARQALQLCETFQIDDPRDVSFPSIGLDKPGVPAVGILLHMARSRTHFLG